MRIKKFVAASIKDATEKMKAELGPEAIIITSRQVSKGGLLNFLEKEMFEITAAVDTDPMPVRSNLPSKGGGNSFADTLQSVHQSGHGRGASRHADDPIESLRQIAQHFEKRGRQAPNGSGQAEQSPGVDAAFPKQDVSGFYQLKGDVDDIKVSLKEIGNHLKYSRMPSLPPVLKEVYVTLLKNEMHEELAADLVQSVYARLGEDQQHNRKIVEQQLVAEIARSVRTMGPSNGKKKRSRVVALVGPTGVGKTTTIAKLAAIGKLIDHQEVALISADTYRIGAIEQLRTFAAIADIPMEVVYKPAEIDGALRKFRGAEIILIDTVGRSQRVKKELTELNRFLDAAEPDEIHLVVSASTSACTMGDIVERFSSLKPNRFLFTKLDEAAAFGPLFGLLRKHTIPISYVTTGQAVPDDIVPAHPTKLAKMIYAGALAHA